MEIDPSVGDRIVAH